MSATDATFLEATAMVDADTGSGGLKETAGASGAAWIYGFYRMGDDERTAAWPNVYMQIDENDESPMGESDVVGVGIRFIIETDRDAADAFTKQNAVAARLRYLMRRKVFSNRTTGGRTWAFSAAERMGQSQLPPTGKNNQLAVSYRTTVRGTG